MTFLTSFSFAFLVQFCTLITPSASATVHSELNLPKFPAILIFGDSTVDTGNNDYVKSPLKANHHPYGMSFPGQVPSGRFCDGKLVPDFLVSLLGLKQTIPPYLQPNLIDYDLRTGVCFASAGSGYDERTTKLTGAIPMVKELDYFKEYIERLKLVVGEKEALEIVNGSLIVISAGTNDFVFNFYDLPTRRLQMNINQYQDFVLNKLQNFAKALYDLGGRTMAFTGLPPIGCVPVQMTAKTLLWRKCVEEENTDAQTYNIKLANLLPNVQASLPGSKILYADIYSPLMDMSTNPAKYGFVETRRGCCGTGELETAFLCSKLSPVCSNPSEYMFFDSIHPTEATYKHLTDAMIKQLLPKLNG